MTDTFQLNGRPIAVGDLAIPRAQAFARFVARPETDAFSLDACFAMGTGEAVCVTVRVPGIPQRPAYDIRYTEPLAVVFRPESTALPDVLSLRTDFPEAPHRLMTAVGEPKALCLFAEHEDDLNLRWTGALLAERIEWWLHGMAYDTLHPDDQPVETLFGGAIRPLIVPSDVFSAEQTDPFVVYSVNGGPQGEILVVERQSAVPTPYAARPFAFYGFMMPAQDHGVMHAEPRTLRDLYDVCAARGYDLSSELHARLRGQIRQDAVGTILLLGVPLRRIADGPVERHQYYGFRCAQGQTDALLRAGSVPEEVVAHMLERPQSVDIGPGALGRVLGVLDGHPGMLVPVLHPDPGANSASVVVNMLLPRVILGRVQAAAYSGHETQDDTTFLAVGQGALGSQLFANLARQGYGTWVLIDDDYFAPHNVVRHAMFGKRFGLPKAAEMARLASESFSGPPLARAIIANAVTPGLQTEEVATAARDAAVILDMSGSGGVCRHLALDVDSDARRMCAFLSPSGRDLVVMAEGAGRKNRLDGLEAQYLRAIIDDPRLEGHFNGGEQSRYGGSCRDLTSHMSQELVALHSAIGAKAVREAVASDMPTLSVWRCDPERMSVARLDLPVADQIMLPAERWTLVLDAAVRAKLGGFRADKLPGETCGVLLGTFDMLHRHIYVCSALPAPPDSIETDGTCERGIEGLEEAVRDASSATYGQIVYIGEWHSHPDGCECIPSGPDQTQMEWVEFNMHLEEKPALILIVGEHNELGVYICEPPWTDGDEK